MTLVSLRICFLPCLLVPYASCGFSARSRRRDRADSRASIVQGLAANVPWRRASRAVQADVDDELEHDHHVSTIIRTTCDVRDKIT